MSDSMKEHYTEGKELAIKNAHRLMNSAILMSEKRNYGLAQSLTLLAYEEAQKAVYCSMVAVGLASENDIIPVFETHNPKIILFDKLFKEQVIIKNNKITFNATRQDIAKAMLDAIKGNQITKEHNFKKNAGFYVNHTDGKWSSPSDMLDRDIQDLLEEYKERIAILIATSEILQKVEYDKMEVIQGFSATTYTKSNGSINVIFYFASKTKDS